MARRRAGGEAKGDDDLELDAELMALLSRLELSARTVRQLSQYGIGIGAMRLLNEPHRLRFGPPPSPPR